VTGETERCRVRERERGGERDWGIRHTGERQGRETGGERQGQRDKGRETGNIDRWRETGAERQKRHRRT